jgi:hypothetical protein
LEEEVGKLMGAVNAGAALGQKDKMKVVWKEDVMKTLLGQLRGQANALNLLLQGLQMESVTDVAKLMKRHGKVLARIEETTLSLRKAYPQNHVPDSLIDSCRSPESIFDAETSTIGEVEFTFDDAIINSKAYRRAFTVARLRGGEPLSTTAQAAKAKSAGAIDPPLSVPSARIGSLQWHAPDYFHANTRLTLTNGFTAFPDWEVVFGVSKDQVLARSDHDVGFAKAYWEFFLGLRILLEATHTLASTRMRPGEGADASNFAVSMYNQYLVMQTSVQALLYEDLLWGWQTHGPWIPFDIELFTSFLDKTRLLHMVYLQEGPENRRRLKKIGEREQVMHMLMELQDFFGETGTFEGDFLELPFSHLIFMKGLLEAMLQNCYGPSDPESQDKIAYLYKECEGMVEQFERAVGN